MAGAGAVIGAACAAGLGAGAVAWLIRRALRREMGDLRAAFRAGQQWSADQAPPRRGPWAEATARGQADEP